MANFMNNVKSNRNDAIRNAVYNGTAGLNELLKAKDLDMSKCDHKIQAMQLIYNPESLVGACTVVAGNRYIARVETEDDVKAYAKGLKQVKGHGAHTPYGDSIWQLGVNVFANFNFNESNSLLNFHYCFYVVTNKEMKELKAKMNKMAKDKITKEDIYALQRDLAPFVRAWQESSIDVTKDKDKKFELTFEDFFGMLNVVSTYNKKHAEKLQHNLEAAKKNDKVKFEITLPCELKDENKPYICNDLLGDVNFTVRDAAVEFVNEQLLPVYHTANMNRYEKFEAAGRESEETKALAFFIKRLYQICYNSLDGSSKVKPEQYAAMRDAAYSYAYRLGIEPEQVINIACCASMARVSLNKEGRPTIKDANKNNFKMYPVKDIFPKELFVALTGKQYTEPVDLAFVRADREVFDNETIRFTNGVSENGCFELAVPFTGTVVEENEMLYQVFENIYDYNMIKAGIVDTTFAEGAKAADIQSKAKEAFDKGEYFGQVISTAEEIVVRGSNANLVCTKKAFLGKMDTTMQFTAKEVLKIADVVEFEKEDMKDKKHKTYQRIFFLIFK